MISITINGNPLNIEAGTTILEAAGLLGIHIPTLCYHPGLPADGNCRMCSVEIEEGKKRKVVMACSYPITKDGLIIETDTPKIYSLRKFVLTLIAKEAKEACNTPVLRHLFEKYNVSVPTRFNTSPDPLPHTPLDTHLTPPLDLSPNPSLNTPIDTSQNATHDSASKCILCGLCVRACEAEGIGCLDFCRRGHQREVTSPFKEPPTSCIGCGACAEVCPTGAIEKLEKDGVRILWGREFQLVQCTRCGRFFATKEQLERAALNYDDDNDLSSYEETCPQCRRKEEAYALVFSKVKATRG